MQRVESCSEIFAKNKVAIAWIHKSLPGENIIPYLGESSRNSMIWMNWDKAFRNLEIDGLSYVNCWFVEGHCWYAIRENINNYQLSRSQAIVSKWSVDSLKDISRFCLGKKTRVLEVYFPVYDGIGYWIGKRRREHGVNYYSLETETNIAIASTESVLSFGQNEESGKTIYQCVWAQGKAYNEFKGLIKSPSNLAFSRLGFEIVEISKMTADGQKLSFKLFGRTISQESEIKPSALTFKPELAIELHPAWKYINSLPHMEDKPDEGDY